VHIQKEGGNLPLDDPRYAAEQLLRAEAAGDAEAASRIRAKMHDDFGPGPTEEALDSIRLSSSTFGGEPALVSAGSVGPQFSGEVSATTGGWQTSRDTDRRRPPIVQG
jgi:hypothetical protein